MSEKRQTILVVDDVPDDILIIEEILKKDYQVKAVTSGEAALKIARSDNPPDLILLDIIMPEMDGFEVCRKLREDAEGAMIPVIFLTAKVMTADEKMGFELGAVDYIRKPVDPEIVKTRIKSHLEQKDEALRSSEVRFRRLFETSKDGVMIVDNGTGMVVDVNPSMTKILGLTQEYFLGKKISELDFLKNIIFPKDIFPKLQQQEYVRYKDQPMETVDGRKIYVEFIYNSYKVNHREVTQLNIRDITNFILAEQERDELAARLSHYLSTSPTVTYSLRVVGGKAPIQWVSENIYNLLGFTPAEALENDWWLHNVYTSDRMRAIGGILKIIRGGSFTHEYRFHKKNRELVWLSDEMRFVQAERGDAEIIGTLTDVTDRKNVESELSLKSTALEAAANAIVITDREGIIKWLNPAYEALTGYTRAEVIGKQPITLSSDEQDDAFYKSIRDTILAGNIWYGQLENKRKNGEFYTSEITITPVPAESKSISVFIVIISDVTERERSRERLEVSLNEKGILLRELHHRINNNMQLITSLLGLSSRNIADAPLRKHLDGISRRIVSIALVHEQFYNSEDMARIDFVLYLHQLADGIGGDSGKSSGRVSIASHEETVPLNLEQAIPAGLIVAELIGNALEHAYPAGYTPGEIRVDIRLLGKTIKLSVRDDGVGLPKAIDVATAESLGMTLIRTLVGQLKGKIEFRYNEGTEAILEFPIMPSPAS
ncbi:MAG: PAS domain S-box protein [Rectinemataceae bacterium]|jgi:PAS domain S-box-containing protein